MLLSSNISLTIIDIPQKAYIEDVISKTQVDQFIV